MVLGNADLRLVSSTGSLFRNPSDIKLRALHRVPRSLPNSCLHGPPQLPCFLGRYAPSLRHLTMELCPLDTEHLGPSPILLNPVSLTLSFNPPNGVKIYSKFPLRDVLDALRSMQQLEILAIAFCSYFTKSPGSSTYFSPSKLRVSTSRDSGLWRHEQTSSTSPP